MIQHRWEWYSASLLCPSGAWRSLDIAVMYWSAHLWGIRICLAGNWYCIWWYPIALSSFRGPFLVSDRDIIVPLSGGWGKISWCAFRILSCRRFFVWSRIWCSWIWRIRSDNTACTCKRRGCACCSRIDAFQISIICSGMHRWWSYRWWKSPRAVRLRYWAVSLWSGISSGCLCSPGSGRSSRETCRWSMRSRQIRVSVWWWSKWG